MNGKLATSLVLLALLSAVALFPSAFTRFPAGYSDSLRSVESPDGVEWLFAPEAPSSYYLFGTDLYGYDILTRIVWGLRWTLAAAFLVAAVRSAVGAVLGVGSAVLRHDMGSRRHARTSMGDAGAGGRVNGGQPADSGKAGKAAGHTSDRDGGHAGGRVRGGRPEDSGKAGKDATAGDHDGRTDGGHDRPPVGDGAGTRGGHGVRGSADRSKGFSPLSAIPGFVVAFFLLYPFTTNSPWQGWRLFLFQAAVLSIIDMAPVAATLGARTRMILASPFIEAARSAGAGRWWLTLHHVRRFILAEVVEQFALQTVSVLQLVGRLGVFSIFLGGTVMAFDPPLLNSATSEIAGLIGLYRLRLLGARWMLLFPLAAYAVVLLTVRLFASGLHEYVRRTMRLYDGTALD